jgi:hypothetical protein
MRRKVDGRSVGPRLVIPCGSGLKAKGFIDQDQLDSAGNGFPTNDKNLVHGASRRAIGFSRSFAFQREAYDFYSVHYTLNRKTASSHFLAALIFWLSDNKIPKVLKGVLFHY